MITRERVKELLDYNPVEGVLRWKVRTARCVRIGEIAGQGHRGEKGYNIGINGKRYKTSRICFLHYYGFLPETVDHINRNPHDNRIINLRAATNAENCRNRKPYGSSKYLGVSWFKQSGKWKAQIKHDGEVIYLGLFEKDYEAAVAYNIAAMELNGEFANLNEI
jgi:hypothetical protein